MIGDKEYWEALKHEDPDGCIEQLNEVLLWICQEFEDLTDKTLAFWIIDNERT